MSQDRSRLFPRPPRLPVASRSVVRRSRLSRREGSRQLASARRTRLLCRERLLEWLRKQHRGRGAQRLSEMHETADADAVRALLVFLNLLEGDAARLAERTLAHTGGLAKRSEALADDPID